MHNSFSLLAIKVIEERFRNILFFIEFFDFYLIEFNHILLFCCLFDLFGLSLFVIDNFFSFDLFFFNFDKFIYRRLFLFYLLS
jgi:hypothetical protein